MARLVRRSRTPEAAPERGRAAKAASPPKAPGKAVPTGKAVPMGKVGSRSMARGRTTPKGPAGGRAAPARAPSGRYTPPQPRRHEPSPRWVPVLMFGLFGVGLALIVANYLGALPHFPGSNQTGGTDNWWLLTGLACVLGGFVVATRYE